MKPRVHIKPGTKHRMTKSALLSRLAEPVGEPSISLAWGSCYLEEGTILTAGLPCTYTYLGGTGKEEAQWFSSGPSSWHLFFLKPGQTMLVPVQDYGPMGALVVDDPSGEDVCADA